MKTIRIRFNIYFVLGIVYITGMTVWAMSSVGYVSETCGDPFTWQLPFSMFVILLFPFLLGITTMIKEYE